MAVDQSGGRVYVADSANARVQRFNKKGQFKAAWGWGVKDGEEESQVCKNKTNCQAGIPGVGRRPVLLPTSIAVDSSKGPSRGNVYVGDAGNNVVQKFNPGGKYLSTIDGSTAPQGHFVSLAGVAVDQNGNLWVADAGTGNVIEFDAAGTFVSSGRPVRSPAAIAVDATNDAVYLINGNGATERFTLTGGSPTTVDRGSGTALALNPQTGNLYVDHGNDVVVYDSAGHPDRHALLAGRGDQLARPRLLRDREGEQRRQAGPPVRHRRGDNLVAIYGPPGAGAPFITAESSQGAGKTSKMLHATIVPLGHKTTCTFQYVTSADFQAPGTPTRRARRARPPTWARASPTSRRARPSPG